MASGFPSKIDFNQALLATLRYSHRFRFPLSTEEAWKWQPFSNYSRRRFAAWPHQKDNLLFLPGFQKLVSVRKKREFFSTKKSKIAAETARFLGKIPSVKMVYITGSLAMNNCKKDDDIDIMIITSPDTVWITRAVIVLSLALSSMRRPYGLSEHSSKSVSGKICDNLYLSHSALSIPHFSGFHPRNYYLAHEILQARPVWGDSGVDRDFIQANSWIKKYFPVAYRDRIQNHPAIPSEKHRSGRNILLFITNAVFFIIQYLYMRSGLTIERVGLDYAFFHPGSKISFRPC